jgi:peptide deformylase
MFEDLKIIVYPDPRLRKVSKPVKEFSPELAALAAKMLELMRAAEGVGLAAPQVGKNIRLFVMNATGEPGDDRVIVNPVLTDPDGEESAEEGCLSIPGVKAQIVRGKAMRLTALDAAGKPIDEIRSGYIARIWQHETDHLNGILLMDRMGTLAKMTHRKTLKELEDKFAAAHPPPARPKPDAHSKAVRKKRK